MDNHWPAIEERFGAQLRTLFVDINTEEGLQIMGQTLAYLGMEPTGVPLLIVGKEALVGSLDIPTYAAEVIQAGLDTGGVGVAPVPALLARMDALIAQTESAPPSSIATEVESTDAPVDALAITNDPAIAESGLTNPGAEVVVDSATALASMEAAATEKSLIEKVTSDPIGNTLAIIVLLLSVASLTLYVLQRLLGKPNNDPWSRAGTMLRPWMLGIAGLFGAALAGTILMRALNTPIVFLLALLQLLAFVFLLACQFIPRFGAVVARWTLPVAAGAGMLVALYLAYVEATANPAVCGAVGECNIVQQSVYASILGIPIGVLGIVGYALILGVALLQNLAPNWVGAKDTLLLEMMTLAGLAASTYLTFLEPFVIGATCAWCLLSALWMLSLLWLVVRWEPRRTNEKRGTTHHRPTHKHHRHVRKSHGHA